MLAGATAGAGAGAGAGAEIAGGTNVVYVVPVTGAWARGAAAGTC